MKATSKTLQGETMIMAIDMATATLRVKGKTSARKLYSQS